MFFTADRQDHDFLLHPVACACGTTIIDKSAVLLLHTLYRGITTARVQDVAFAANLIRWAAVTTMRGTTHVSPSVRMEEQWGYATKW